jgi:hypothetical protein
MKRMKREELTPEQLASAQRLIAKNLQAKAFAERDTRTSRGKNPWNPSVTATVRAANPLPVPTTCPCCGSSKIECVHHDDVYGRQYSEWPWMLRCETCEATVGLHPFTNIPLGTLATRVMRQARMRAKEAFNPLWEGGGMTRTEAYTWLAQKLGIARVEECHIGWFDVQQCNRVVEVCEAYSLA